MSATPGTTNYPAVLDVHSDTAPSPAGFGILVNLLSTTLPSEVSASATSLTVTSNIGFPTAGTLVVGLANGDTEHITYTGLSGTTSFTGCTRGAGGTTAQNHPKGSMVASVRVAANHNDLAAAIVAVETVLGERGGAVLLGSPIINGGPVVWQDGATFTSIADGTWTADNWVYLKSGAVVHDVLRSADVPAVAALAPYSNYSLHLDVTTADAAIAAGDYAAIATRIEGFNWAAFAQRTLSISFWVKAGKAGAHAMYLKNSGNDRTYIAEYTVFVADTWEFKTLTITASPSAGTWNYTTGRGLEIGFTQYAGSTYQTTSGAWALGDYKATANQVNECDSTANNFKIYGLAMGLGSSAPVYSPVSYAQEYLRCLRYYELVQSTGALYPFSNGYLTTTTVMNAMMPFFPKRAAATITYGTATDFEVVVGGGAYACNAITSAAGPYTDRVFIQATSGTVLTANIGAILAAVNSSAFIKVASRIP